MQIDHKEPKITAFHLAGIIPVAGQKLDYNFPWHDSLMPLAPNYLAIEHAGLECANAGCETIWIVCHNDMQPLIRHRLGDWVQDAAVFERGSGPWRTQQKQREIPLFYVPIHPKDRGRRDCLGWSVLYGTITAYHINRKLSKWVIPDKYFISFPYGITPLDIIRKNRRLISAKKNFCLTYRGQNVKNNKYLSFTYDGPDFQRCRRNLRQQQTHERDENHKRLPLHERWDARWFPLDKVFEPVDFEEANTLETPWYYGIDNWEGYCEFLSSEERKEFEKPEYMKYREWNPIGEDNE